TYDREIEVSEAGTRLVIALEQALSEQVGKVFRDGLVGGGTGPEMVVLPRGSFRMGCLGEKKCTESELPVRTVSIMRPIAMMKYEVTFADFDRYVNATGEPAPNDAGWGRGRNPVIDVNWEDAWAYADWLSAQTGATYRLPSEAEWEYAARAGTESIYSWGNDIERGRANYGSDKCCQGKAAGADRWLHTAPVGSFGANAWGLHDMSGNVWEWVQDCYNLGYLGAPDDGQPRERCSTTYRVVRGGSWEGSPYRLRLAVRGGRDPAQRRDVYGFRLVREL
ncbi:MAG: formylglycine-generating enzyme family protein, partial [Halioglobus sp.]|nr:formylglycine-generating enzyme family protein [Halioglobus sp.]